MPAVTAEGLFATWFWPHYPPDVRSDPTAFRYADANPAGNPSILLPLAQAADLFAANAPALLDIAPTFDAAGIALLSRALDARARDRLLAASDPAERDNLFVSTVVHGSAFVGEVIVRAFGGRWEARRPLWESVVHRGSGGAVPPFHWLLKSLADDAIDTVPLAARFHVHVALAGADPSVLPVITAPRRLPALRFPAYDTLVKYLHQHLPSLADVGGFPTPVEFTARGYATLGFELFHGGRVLALHGHVPSRDGVPGRVEVLWLTAGGFDHADAFPTDADVPPFVRALNDELLEVTVAWKGRPTTHRLGFRGHR